MPSTEVEYFGIVAKQLLCRPNMHCPAEKDDNSAVEIDTIKHVAYVLRIAIWPTSCADQNEIVKRHSFPKAANSTKTWAKLSNRNKLDEPNRHLFQQLSHRKTNPLCPHQPTHQTLANISLNHSIKIREKKKNLATNVAPHRIETASHRKPKQKVLTFRAPVRTAGID